MSRVFRSRKAFSPILATLLLVVIAVAGIVVTYAWITTYMGTTTQTGLIPYKANVAFAPSGHIAIGVGNSGTSSGNVVQILYWNIGFSIKPGNRQPSPSRGSHREFDRDIQCYFYLVSGANVPFQGSSEQQRNFVF